MYQSLKTQPYYEELYDDITVEYCRSGEQLVNDVFTKMEQELPLDELNQQKPGWYLYYSTLYFWHVEVLAAKRCTEREDTITEWMQRDKEKDQRLAEARLSGNVYCLSCGEDMEVMHRTYMHREGHKEDDILLMFKCSTCDKRRAYWQYGTEWEKPQVKCKKCGGGMESSHKKKGEVVTTTMACSKCGHKEVEVMDLSKSFEPKEAEIDPYYDLDRRRFVFDRGMMFKFEQKVQHLVRLGKLHADAADKAEHVDVYDAVKDIKKLKVAQLSELLAPLLVRQGYTEFKLGQPQFGREATIDFNCLDADASREGYKSEKNLQKIIDKALIDTNWRLMSDGVNQRLGYLSGRLRAYESEEELKKLVEQRIKSGKLPLTPPKKATDSSKTEPMHKFEGMQLREAALVYMDKMTLNSKPAEVTLKSGKKKRTGVHYITAEMNPLLKVIIPMRDNDDSVPKFIRTYDFKIGNNKDIPKVSKDELGREVRLINDKI